MKKRLTVVALSALLAGGFTTAAVLYRGAEADPANAATPQPAVDAKLLVRPHSPIIGPRNARVTIVEFFDPSCEACRAFHPIVKDIMSRNPKDVRLVLRYAPFHRGSEEAVRIMEAARTQGVYEPVMAALLESQPQWHDGDMTGAWAAAKAAGLDEKKARAALASPKVTAMMKQDVADGEALKIPGTPTFYVNGRPLVDFGPQQLDAMVAAEVQAIRK